MIDAFGLKLQLVNVAKLEVLVTSPWLPLNTTSQNAILPSSLPYNKSLVSVPFTIESTPKVWHYRQIRTFRWGQLPHRISTCRPSE